MKLKQLLNEIYYPLKLKAYHGSGSKTNKIGSSKVRYWSTNKRVAELYGDKIKTKVFKFKKYKIFYFNFNGWEINENSWQVELIEKSLIKSQKGEEVEFRIFGSEQVMPANCEYVVILDIIDPPDGSVGGSEDDADFERKLRYYEGDIIIEMR